ncbi:MAG TPA: hypothetical protein VFR46_02405, partial [Actinomycetes bacterium]|nr:hypothetical protein [Actinomycetes bacterium]
DFALAAGYTDGMIVFNRTGVDGCETLINMLLPKQADGSQQPVPAIFIPRTDGFRILGLPVDAASYSCSVTGGTEGPAGVDVPEPSRLHV